jgi:hypothetical protein
MLTAFSLVLAWVVIVAMSVRLDTTERRIKRLEETSQNGWRWTP